MTNQGWRRVSHPGLHHRPMAPRRSTRLGARRRPRARGGGAGHRRRQRAPLRPEAAGHLIAAGGKRFRPMLALLAAQLGDPDARRWSGGRGLRAHPPGHAVPRRRDGRGRHAPRRTQREQPVVQQRGDPGRRPAVRAGVRPGGRPRARGRAHPGPHVRAVGHRPDPGDGGSAAGGGPGRPLPRRAGRQDRLPGGDVGAVRCGLRRRRSRAGRRSSPPSARRWASPSSSPTTCSTSSARTARRGSRPEPTCARGSRPCRCCWRWPATIPPRAGCASCVGGPITDDGEHEEALELLRSSASLGRANDMLRDYADRARARLAGVPAGDVRDALSALCDYVVTRTS